MASITGKNRDRGSIFSQETRRGYWRPHKQKIFVLLTFIMLINTISKKCSSHIKSKKQNFFVAKVMEAKAGFYYR